MRSTHALATALALAGSLACAHQPPPLPVEPADVLGTVWTIQGSFEGGGILVVHPYPVPGQAAPLATRIELRPGAPVVVRRQVKLQQANFSRLQLGQRIAAWWDGEPTTSESGGRAGPVRVLVIELDPAPGA